MNDVPTGFDALPALAASAAHSLHLALPGIAVLIVLVAAGVLAINHHLNQKD